MKTKPKVEYFLEWRAGWPEVSWEPYGNFTSAAKVREHVKMILDGGDKVRVSKIVTKRKIYTPKGWVKYVRDF